ncbi:MAG: restriction endonuclease subunit S [Geobacteraceae bacterium]|nr:restriction endonuclease subunit S [Geobacteraceae bacterium]
MELKPGYKQTEVGVIPEDWEVMSWGDVIENCSSGATPYRGTPEFYRGNVPWVTSGELNYNIITDTIEHISSDAVKKTALRIHPAGTFLMAITGLEAAGTRGACAITGIAATTNQSCMAIYPSSHLDTEYLYHYYRFRGNELALKYCQGTKQQSYTAKLVRKLPLPMPPTKAEQLAIATALSDVDALLESFDQLIIKKRNLKQAAMQELLTGKTRLPGFDGAWVVKRLGDIAYIKTGSRNNENKQEDGEFPFFVRSATVERIDRYSYDCEAILVPGEGQIGSVFHYINGRFDVHQRVYAITQFAEYVSGRYVFVFMSKFFGNWAMQNTVKATVDSLRLPTFLTYELHMPPTIEEQTAIATVLSDMDSEITVLEQRRKKTKDLKQAMMQELLTGKTRLV